MMKRYTMIVVGSLVLLGCAGPLTPRDTQQAIRQEIA